MSNDSITVDIWRGKQDGEFKTYLVPRAALQTVLDLVTYVQRVQDHSLSYRFACRVGMCGTCAMSVNGVPLWTCRTQASVFANKDRIKIAPLRNFPVVKDLVVDMSPFFDKWTAAGGAFFPSHPDSKDFSQVSPSNKSRKAADETIQCINCGICYSACDVVNWKPEYLGPAALNRAWSVINDERNQPNSQALNLLASDSGCLSCHTTRSCTRFCPKHLNPSKSIASLKSRTLRNKLK